MTNLEMHRRLNVGPRRDRRGAAFVAVISAVAALGYAVSLMPDRGVSSKAPIPTESLGRGFDQLSIPSAVPDHPKTEESVADNVAPVPAATDAANTAMRTARRLIGARRFDDAVTALHSSRDVLRARAEAYLLLGQALEGKGDYNTARDFYNAALDRDPWLADAHWGFATTSEALGDLESALAGMRSYLHTEKDPDPMRLRINQARSALWEWEAKLARGPWGPTRGIPPGFLAEDLKRDGRGVGIKWPREETLQPDGTMKSEIKSAEKIKIYPRP